jgi:hypothetical protein
MHELPAWVPIPNPAVACRPSDDGWLVLVNLDTARSVALNPTAASIWRLVDGSRDPARIVNALGSTWDDVPADATTHVDEVLATLEDAGFVGREVARYTRGSRSPRVPCGEE